MSRAYIRLDPSLPERKEEYPDGAFRAFVECFCYAETQPRRGHFRNVRILRAYLGRRARWIPYLVAHGDLAAVSDGSYYVEGWEEWQEGDVTVADRMKRIRAKRAVTVRVTPPVTGPRLAESSSAGLSRAPGSNAGPGLKEKLAAEGYRP